MSERINGNEEEKRNKKRNQPIIPFIGFLNKGKRKKVSQSLNSANNSNSKNKITNRNENEKNISKTQKIEKTEKAEKQDISKKLRESNEKPFFVDKQTDYSNSEELKVKVTEMPLNSIKHKKEHLDFKSFIPTNIELRGHIESVLELKKYIKKGKNVLIEGPTGSGKTYLVKFICQELNKPLFKIECSNQTRTSDIIGKRGLKDGTIWIDGPLILAMKSGGVLFIDEINFARSQVLSSLYGPLNGDELQYSDEDEIKVLKPKKGFCVIAAYNPPRDGYKNRKPLDAALKRRFGKLIEVSYLKEKDEISFLKSKFTKTPTGDIKILVKFANKIRSMHIKEEISSAPSPKNLETCLEEFSEHSSNLTKKRKSVETTIVNFVTDEHKKRKELMKVYDEMIKNLS